MKKLLFLMALLMGMMSSYAGEPGDTTQMILEELKRLDSIEKSLDYKTGTLVLGNGIATINVPEGFKFLESKDASYVLYELWGNLKSEEPLGLLFPDYSGATDPTGFAFVIQYEAIGYVKDKDANKIDYDDMMKDLKESQVEANLQRKTLGLQTIDVIGWAAKPYYDAQRKILYWAKEISVEGEEENTLNYDVRVLGRKGMLTLQAIANINSLDSVNKNLDNVLSMVSFNPGHTYADFNSKTDDVAAWTIGGLVAGKVLAKAGFFALILKNIKLVAIGLIAFGGVIWRFISGRRKKEEEFVYTPATPPQRNEPSPPTE